MESLPSVIFLNLRRLRFLFLHGCALTTLAIGEPSVSPYSLKFTWEVTRSNFVIDESYVPSLEAMWLFGNPINCDCNLLPLVWFISRRGILLDASPRMLRDKQYDNATVERINRELGNNEDLGTYCATPFNRHNAVISKEIRSIPDNDLICPDQMHFIIFAMSLGIVSFTASLPLALVAICYVAFAVKLGKGPLSDWKRKLEEAFQETPAIKSEF